MNVHSHGLCVAALVTVAIGAFAGVKAERACQGFQFTAGHTPRQGGSFTVGLEITGPAGKARLLKVQDVQLP